MNTGSAKALLPGFTLPAFGPHGDGAEVHPDALRSSRVAGRLKNRIFVFLADVSGRPLGVTVEQPGHLRGE